LKLKNNFNTNFLIKGFRIEIFNEEELLFNVVKQIFNAKTHYGERMRKARDPLLLINLDLFRYEY